MCVCVCETHKLSKISGKSSVKLQITENEFVTLKILKLICFDG